MSDKYPLYPDLKDPGPEEAQKIIDAFKEKLKKIAEEAIGELYTDVPIYIESDSWTNFRNELLAGLCNYNNAKLQVKYEFAKIRRAIFDEYKTEIIADLNQDLVEEVADLKKQLSELREYMSREREWY